MDGCRQRAEGGGLVEDLRRSQAVRREAGVVLGDLLGEVDVEGSSLGRRDERGQLVARDRPDRVDGGPDPRVVGLLEARDPGRPGLGAAVVVPHLGTLGRLAEARAEVAGVEQRDPEPRTSRRLDQRVAHRVGVVVRRAVGLVVEVVELADSRDPGGDHLAERDGGQVEIAVGVQARCDVVHLLAPGPEGPPAPLRPPAQRAVEGVAVAVREPGDGEPGEGGGAVLGIAGRPAIPSLRSRCNSP